MGEIYNKHHNSLIVRQCLQQRNLTLLATGWFRGFLKKKRLNARGFAWEFLNPKLTPILLNCSQPIQLITSILFIP